MEQEDFNPTFGRRLVILMANRDMKQTDLAKLFHINKSTVSRWTKGQLPPTPMILKLADLFGTTVDWLLGRNSPPQDWRTEMRDTLLDKGWSERRIERAIKAVEILAEEGPQ